MEMHARCSAETVLRLFAAPMTRLDPRLARRLLLGGAGAMVAAVGDRMVGIAALADVVDGRCEVSLLVEDGWQRRGIGTRLLGAAAHLGAGRGAEDVVLRGPAESPAAVAMVFGSGLRARVRLAGDELLVSVSTRGLAPVPAATTADGPPSLTPA
jgi:GNAT superfamily N-acetyltransferase